MPIYYLAFQRAPPISAVPDELINVSPTIVNDLRDEVYQLDATTPPLRITLAWIARLEGSFRKLSDAATCDWEGPRSAYKACSIRLPSKGLLQKVKSVHLAIWATQGQKPDSRSQKRTRKEDAGHQEWVYDLASLPTPEEDSLVILPVLSAPIKVLSGASEKVIAGKSPYTIRLFRFESMPIVEICEESGYELDKHIWDASLHLSAYLWNEYKSNETSAPLSLFSTANLLHGLRAVELGSGTGMVTVLLSAILDQVLAKSASAEETRSLIHLTATDLPSAMPLLERNIDVNGSIADGIRIDCRPLDWSEESHSNGTQLILVSDCTYNPTYFEPLCKTTESLLMGAKQPALCLLAKKHRHEDEEELWGVVGRHGLRASLLAGRQDVKDGHWGLWKLECIEAFVET